ncbi:MAG: nif-specific transcriptional activator NifA [Planctomycetota bacterium]|nr:nif-specific transcriptional activator NifA [Planctomycetota bacterium]
MVDRTSAADTARRSTMRQDRELSALYRISRIIAAQSRQGQMLKEVLDVLHNELGMRRGTIALVSPDAKELLIEVAHNIPRRQRQAVRYRMGEGIVGRVVQTGKPAVVPKISQEPLFLDRIHRRRTISKDEISFICVPIAVGNDVAGALSADRIFDESASLDEDVRVLSIVASMIANDVQVRREVTAERSALEAENIRLRSELEDRFRPENIIGNSGSMREVYRAIHQVAVSDTTVLIRGESGTGKELVAHAIHYSSPRGKGPFVKVNCAALSESLLESELFGHERGAFTGAIQMRKGRLEETEGGTLFLDEVGDFSTATQVKLLRVLQEREFERVGSNQTRKANVRILCATNRKLEQLVESDEFRQDLYYRINVFPIFLPPLRDRKDDILLLADHFIERYSGRMSKDVRRISTPAINMMVVYHWPGNVRELENCIERAVLLSTDGVIHGHHLPPTLQTSDYSDTVGTGTLTERVDLFERDIIVDALKRSNGNTAAAARDLGTTARILRYKIQQLDIDVDRFRRAGG